MLIIEKHFTVSINNEKEVMGVALILFLTLKLISGFKLRSLKTHLDLQGGFELVLTRK